MDNSQMKAVWVKPEIHKALKEHCDKNGKKMIFVVEQLLKEKLEANV
tara:strand:- start:4967 stop:5107 length:141 start_codon:yes stop_codon:yes gene_type:complete